MKKITKKITKKKKGKAPRETSFEAAIELGGNPGKWHLRLYVAGQTGKSELALRNLRLVCETYLKGLYRLEVIDLMKQPQLARGDQIFAIPTLIKKVPKPVRKIIGDLSDLKKVLVGLDIKEMVQT